MASEDVPDLIMLTPEAEAEVLCQLSPQSQQQQQQDSEVTKMPFSAGFSAAGAWRRPEAPVDSPSDGDDSGLLSDGVWTGMHGVWACAGSHWCGCMNAMQRLCQRGQPARLLGPYMHPV